jgi:hypothetical protein
MQQNSEDEAGNDPPQSPGENKRKREEEEYVGAHIISEQELRELGIIAKKKEAQHLQFQHMLKSLMADPSKFKRPEFRYLREFISHVENNRDIFPDAMGDKTIDPTKSVSNVGE